MTYDPQRGDERIRHAGCRITIERDDDAQNPADYGDVNTATCGIFLRTYHDQFYVDGRNESSMRMSRHEAVEWVEGDNEGWEIFPLYAYIHSGVVLAVGAPDARWPDQRWDVSHLGFIAVSTDPKHGFDTPEKRQAAAAGLAREWNTYLAGDVWGYVVEAWEPTGEGEGEWVDVDSCWGFYGQKYAIEQAKAEADGYRADHPLLFPPPDHDYDLDDDGDDD